MRWWCRSTAMYDGAEDEGELDTLDVGAMSSMWRLQLTWTRPAELLETSTRQVGFDGNAGSKATETTEATMAVEEAAERGEGKRSWPCPGHRCWRSYPLQVACSDAMVRWCGRSGVQAQAPSTAGQLGSGLGLYCSNRPKCTLARLFFFDKYLLS